MKFPMRADFPDALAYAAALERHSEINDIERSRIRLMYENASPISEKPQWVCDERENKYIIGNISSETVDPAAGPDDDFLEAVFDQFAMMASENEAAVTNLAYGTVADPETNGQIWACWVEMTKMEMESVSA